jgi:hypothetical protein
MRKNMRKLFLRQGFYQHYPERSCLLHFQAIFLLYEPDPSDPITRSPLPFLPGKRKGMVE